VHASEWIIGTRFKIMVALLLASYCDIYYLIWSDLLIPGFKVIARRQQVL